MPQPSRVFDDDLVGGVLRSDGHVATDIGRPAEANGQTFVVVAIGGFGRRPAAGGQGAASADLDLRQR